MKGTFFRLSLLPTDTQVFPDLAKLGPDLMKSCYNVDHILNLSLGI